LFFVGDVTTGAGLRAILAEATWLWAPTQRAIFGLCLDMF